ncbi:hypothetical protein MMC22_004182 [Lobaria immixta]|nr:hypothetical protein [Lobaria immixta]
MSVVPGDSMRTYAKSDALLIGIMQKNFASPAEYLRQQSSNTKEDILIFKDTLGQRSRALVKKLPDDFAAQRGKVVDALKGKIPSQLPTRMIILQDLKYQEIQNSLPAVDITHYNRFVGRLYQAQEEAVQMALQFKVSNIFGLASKNRQDLMDRHGIHGKGLL